MAKVKRNPYLNRSMIRSVGEFCGRQREIERVMSRIGAATPQSVSIVGQRRVGKSSLLWHLAQAEIHGRYLDQPNRYIFLLIDFQGQRHIDLEGFSRVFSRELTAAVGKRAKIAEASDFTGLEEALQKLATADLNLVCLFDEFETITRNPGFGEEFFGFLRSSANSYPVAFVTSSRRELETLCHTQEISESPFFNIFSKVRLGPLGDSEVRDLIVEPSATAGVPLEKHAAAIMAMSGRLPFFLQMACSSAFECLVESASPEVDVDLLTRRFTEEAESHFRYLWDHLGEADRALMDRVLGGELGCEGARREHGEALNRMIDDGYIIEDDGTLRVFSNCLASIAVGGRGRPVPGAEAVAKPVAEEPAPNGRPDARDVAVSTPSLEESRVEPIPKGENPYPQIVGDSLSLRRVFALIQKAAAADVTVLLAGETGTGKELVARIVHEGSERRDGPFIVVNCGAIAESLQESELFGHKKGAFTGAMSDRVGLFEAADGGTILLDEIGETVQSAQVRLLRVLQEGEVRRVGETQTRKVDVRVICATNRNLEDEVANGNFREDLYYRLFVLVLRLPPLRERRDDIQKLVEHFLEDYKSGNSAEAMRALKRYGWPGNIRELENQLASARAMAAGETIEPIHLWPRLQQGTQMPESTFAATTAGNGGTLREARDEFERQLLKARLNDYEWEQAAAAKSLGISRSRLYELIRKHSLQEGGVER